MTGLERCFSMLFQTLLIRTKIRSSAIFSSRTVKHNFCLPLFSRHELNPVYPCTLCRQYTVFVVFLRSCMPHSSFPYHKRTYDKLCVSLLISILYPVNRQPVLHSAPSLSNGKRQLIVRNNDLCTLFARINRNRYDFGWAESMLNENSRSFIPFYNINLFSI